jgi:RNA polymerase sigma-70 factor (ECF subfamily)
MKEPSAEKIRIWVGGISESDRQAFDSLFRHLYPRLVHFAMKYTRSKAVASDMVQDAFVTLWEKRRELDPDRSVKAYLYRIVRNSSLNHIRDHSSKTVGLEAVNDSRFKSNEGINWQDETEKFTTVLKAWIEDLPDRQREAFELSRFEGLEHDEIAGVMEISPNTVNNHIVAALNALKDRYSEYQEEAKNEQKGL